MLAILSRGRGKRPCGRHELLGDDRTCVVISVNADGSQQQPELLGERSSLTFESDATRRYEFSHKYHGIYSEVRGFRYWGGEAPPASSAAVAVEYAHHVICTVRRCMVWCKQVAWTLCWRTCQAVITCGE